MSIIDEFSDSTPAERALVMCMERIALLEQQVSSLQAGSFMLSGGSKESLYMDAVMFTLGVTSTERKRLRQEWDAIYQREMASLSNIPMKLTFSYDLAIELARSRVQQQQCDSRSLSRAMSLHAAAFHRSVALPPPWSPECLATAYDWSALDIANMLGSMDMDELQRMWQWRLSYLGYNC
jgi:hypothetical protein